jgi:hypothetical protein
MSKIVEIIVAHCEVCPYVSGTKRLRCRYPPNRDMFMSLHSGRTIYKSELPIPKWCKLPNADSTTRVENSRLNIKVY